MKTVLKLISGLLIGIIAGFAIAAVIIVIFTDQTLSQFLHNLISVDGLETIAAAAVGVLSFAISCAVIIPVHEAGHLVCGLMTGYRFVSFRIFNLTFIRIDGKTRVKRFSVAGTGGQCLLTPPDLPLEKVPTAWYNAGGVIANLLLLLLVAPLFFLDLNPFVFEALAIFCLTDAVIILINGIPMKLGAISNDGYNLLHLNKDILSKRAMVMQLRTNALIQNGMRPKDMPDDWFEWKTDINYKNPLEVSIPLMHASRLIDEMDWDKAYDEFDLLYSHKDDIMQLYVYEIECELLFCSMILGKTERAGQLLTTKLQEYIKTYSKTMSSKQRILCAEALFLDNDRTKALDIYKSLEADKDKYLLVGEVKSDLAIMNHMLDTTNACGNVEVVTPEKFRSLISGNQDICLIDARTPEEYEQGHLHGAMLIDWLDNAGFRQKATSLDKSKTVYIYCRSGKRSNEAARYLASLGYNIVDMDGGILRWMAEGYPVESN